MFQKVKTKLQKKLDKSFSQKNILKNKVSVTDDLDDDLEVDTKPSQESEILEIKNDLQETRDIINSLNTECDKIKAQQRFVNLTSVEKELNTKVDENLRIKTTVQVLHNRLAYERVEFNLTGVENVSDQAHVTNLGMA